MRTRHGTSDSRHDDGEILEADAPRAEVVSMVVGTFREMPGLSLHNHQAARLFGLRPTTCQVVLDDLVATGQLRRAGDGQYVAGDLERTRLSQSVRQPRVRPHSTGRV
jgi:hypothetical protein